MRLRIKRERLFLAFTLLRIVLALVVGILIIYHRKNIATIFFIATALISFFESMITKRLIEKSLLKSILDFFADRFLINIAAIALALKGLLPVWVMLVFLTRDLLTLIIGFTLMLVVAGVSFRAYRNTQKANEIISGQKDLVEEKQKEILDSIHYAKRIQKSLLPTGKYIYKNLNKS